MDLFLENSFLLAAGVLLPVFTSLAMQKKVEILGCVFPFSFSFLFFF